MKKHIFTAIALLLAVMFVAPSVLSLAAYAADESNASEVDIWEKLDPAYRAAEFTSVQNRIAGDGEDIPPMDLIIVSEGYALYSDKYNGEVICLKLPEPDENGEYPKYSSGVYKYVGYYCTNPYKLGSSTSITTQKPSSDAVKKTLLSQIIIKYQENTNETTLESYASSAMFDQIKSKIIRGGLRLEYTIGREETTYLVPRQIKLDKWMNLLIQISENANSSKTTKTFMAYYTTHFTEPEQVLAWGETFDPSGLSEVTKEYLFMTRDEYRKRYDDNAWGIKAGYYDWLVDRAQNTSKRTREQDLKDYPCTKNFAIQVFEGSAKAAEIRRVEQFVKLYTDYTKERMEEDHAETEYSSNDKIPALFKMALEYTIDKDGLYIRLNAGKIRFDSSNYTLKSIAILPYAGACDVHNGGYIFSPDGSGTLFDLQAIAGSQFTTTSSIYGQDYAYHSVTGGSREVVRYPAFGAVETLTTSEKYTEIEVIIDENGEEVETEVEKSRDTYTNYGYLAVVTAGDSLAKLTVTNGGSLHMFASAYTTFNPRPSDTYPLSGGLSAGTDAMWTVESKRRYTGDYGIRVFILDTEHSSYSGMASVYRDYLETNGVITRLEEESEDIPLYIEALGAIDTTKTFLGIPYQKSVPLTSFTKALEILQTLKDKAGIRNVKLIYDGWCNDGMIPLVPNGIDICDALGGEEEFNKLVEYAKDPANGNITLFPDLDFMLAAKDEMFDGFSSKDDLSRTINDEGCGLQYYDPLYQGYTYSRMGIISPNSIERFYNSTYADYSKYNVGGIAVTTMGQYLSSDFDEDEPLNREDSKKIVSRLLARIKEDNGKVLTAGGNYYSWPYVTDIVNVPLEDSHYNYTVAPVPFYGMLIHGYIEFSGTAINLAGDYRNQFLRTIESGASPMFVIAAENTSVLKNYINNWKLSKYYSVKYAIWLQDMCNTYNELNEVLKSVKYSRIIEHEFVDDEYRVVKVTYENGTVFFINYLTKDYTVEYGGEKITIPATGYIKTAVE